MSAHVAVLAARAKASFRIWRHGGVTEALERAVACLEECLLLLAAAGEPPAPEILTSLSMCLVSRASSTAARDTDLDRAVELARAATMANTLKARHEAEAVHQLALALNERYEARGDIEDLLVAGNGYGRAADLAHPWPRRQARYLVNYGQALSATYDLDPRRNRQALDKAVDALLTAVRRLPEGSAKRAVALAQLGIALAQRAGDDAIRRPGDGHKADAALRTAVSLARLPSERAAWLNNLGNLQRAEFLRSGDRSVLDAARDAYEQAVSSTPVESRDRPCYQLNLATVWQDLHRTSGQPEHWAAARTAYESVCRCADLDPRAASEAAERWGGWASENGAWSDACEAYTHAIVVNARLTARQSSPVAKATQYWETRCLYADATFAFARYGKLVEARAALETGRLRFALEAMQLKRLEREHAAPADVRARVVQELAALDARLGRKCMTRARCRVTCSTFCRGKQARPLMPSRGSAGTCGLLPSAPQSHRGRPSSTSWPPDAAASPSW